MSDPGANALEIVDVPNVCEQREEVVLDSVALARLLEEVRNAKPSEPHAYNRMHNRHNR